ncbi:MAG: ABC transporter permease [Firmicutes bacterium]|jgi:peptide/nickel transport system permease protein|nr:ABC transporter permease [Bacillota bacterium]
MGSYVLKRILYMIPTLLVISVITFIIIQLPPGDYLTSYIATLEQSGAMVSEAEIASLRRQYGLDQPMVVQYLQWMWKLLHGDFGMSFQWNRPVRTLIGERLGLTMVISTATLVFTWVVAIPIGIYSAMRQYSLGDYVATVIGMLGVAVPNFLLALVIMYFAYTRFGLNITGLFSREMAAAPWSVAKFVDMLKHIWAPVIVVGMAGTAQLIRIMRAGLLDELGKPYVEAARAKGIPERRLIFKYPVRLAINPLVSTIGWSLPGIISGETIVSVVLSLETTGPLLLRALLSQDMYLAGSFILMLSLLTVIGTLISDILLALLDPRIRYE